MFKNEKILVSKHKLIVFHLQFWFACHLLANGAGAYPSKKEIASFLNDYAKSYYRNKLSDTRKEKLFLEVTRLMN